MKPRTRMKQSTIPAPYKDGFKVGDRIRRKDMPELTMVISGEREKDWVFDTSYKNVFGTKRLVKQTSIISKDDDRWEKVP